MRKALLFCAAALAAMCSFAAPAAAAEDANINLSHCIARTDNIGSTTYHNICSGTSKVVEWGSADWIGAISLGLLIGCLVTFIVGGLGMLIYSIWNEHRHYR